uniref:Uncharacterized protein n=1 Tax=Nelumbo nucifera TaxID=4432 RepID=A0A822ZKA2_NELNU|nr:TPA_asm: hypothetical protein HUJ06_002251 [Nelumbo nucifera]
MPRRISIQSFPLNQSCLSRNFSIRTESVAKPAQATHAAFGPPRSTVI